MEAGSHRREAPDDGDGTPAIGRGHLRPSAARDAGMLSRVCQRMDDLLVSDAEREETSIDERIRAAPGVTRANVVAVISPKGVSARRPGASSSGTCSPPTSSCAS
jgi:hypothetical protein